MVTTYRAKDQEGQELPAECSDCTKMRKYPGRTPGGGRRGREGCGRDVSRGCTPVGQWKNSGSSSAGTRSSERGWSHTVLSCIP
jgi:hypothetical protein